MKINNNKKKLLNYKLHENLTLYERRSVIIKINLRRCYEKQKNCKKVKKLQKKKNKLVAKFKRVKKSPALKIINKEKINGGENIQATASVIEPSQSH